MALPDLTCPLHPWLACTGHPAAALGTKCQGCRCTVHRTRSGVCASNPPAHALQIPFYPLLTRLVHACTLLARALARRSAIGGGSPGEASRELAGESLARVGASGGAALRDRSRMWGRLALRAHVRVDVCSSCGEARAAPESIQRHLSSAVGAKTRWRDNCFHFSECVHSNLVDFSAGGCARRIPG